MYKSDKNSHHNNASVLCFVSLLSVNTSCYLGCEQLQYPHEYRVSSSHTGADNGEPGTVTTWRPWGGGESSGLIRYGPNSSSSSGVNINITAGDR